MASFNAAVVTEKGLELLAKVHAGTTDLIISAVATGAGIYSEGEELISRTSLKDPRQSFAPTAIDRQRDTEASIRFSITNNPPSGPITEGYNVTEIGIIATDPDVGNILYAIAVSAADGSDYLPAYDGVVPAVIGAQFVIAVSNADTVIIHTDISAYVTQDELTEHTGDGIRHITSAERAKWNGKENATEWVEFTLLATGWSGSSYSLESIYPSTEYDIVNVQPTANTTEAMRKAWSKADCGGYSTTNVITAHGAVPEIDIVLGLCVRPK